MRKHLLILLLFAGCAQKVTTNGASEKPSWLSAKPQPSGYYTGVGHSVKANDNNYIQLAKKEALEDLISGIKVEVSSTSILSTLDVNREFSERFEQEIKTTAADEIENFELAGSWEDDTNYWVYYRLSKEEYQRIKEEKKRNAVLLGTDFLQKGKASEAQQEFLQALGFYLQGIRAMDKYLGQAITVTMDGRDVFLSTELVGSAQSLLDRINLQLQPAELSINRRISGEEIRLSASAFIKNTNVPIKGVPLLVNFQKGNGVLHPTAVTDETGLAPVLITKIDSKDLEQSIAVTLNMEDMIKGDQSAIFMLITKTLHKPSAVAILRVKRPVIYMTSDERDFGRGKRQDQLSSTLKNLLTINGFEFSNDRRNAEMVFRISSDTERGSVSGSIYVTYLSGSISVITANDGREIFSTTLDRIRGYGLDYERSSADAYNKANESLEKERFSQLLDVILQ